MPSGDSTPSASGLNSRCSPRSWLTSGGPSRRRLVEYQNVSGRPALLSSRPTAFRVATNLRLSPGLSHLAPESSYHQNWCGRNGGPREARPRAVVACLGEGVPSGGSDITLGWVP